MATATDAPATSAGRHRFGLADRVHCRDYAGMPPEDPEQRAVRPWLIGRRARHSSRTLARADDTARLAST